MIKVLRILNRFNIGGPIYNAAYLSKYLPDEYETMLLGGAIGADEKDALHILDNLGIRYQVIPEMKRELNFKQDRKAYKAILKIIREYKPDIVHTHASKAGALGRLAASKEKVPIIVHTFHGHVFHSYFSRAKSHFYQRVERYLAKKSSTIIAISPEQKHELVNVFKIAPDHKTAIVPLGFDLSKFSTNMEQKRVQFRETYGLEHDTIVVGIIGRIVPIKNHELFLKSLARLKESTNKKWKALIVGDGEHRGNIEQLARKLGLVFSDNTKNKEDDLYFTSFLKDVDQVMAGIDIVALSSLNEGTPVSLIEAQAAAKPIVTTRVGGVESVVLENETALIATSNNVDEYHAHLLELVGNEKLRKSFSNNGPIHVLERYHYTRLTKDIHLLYSELLSKVKRKS